ncbi:hypothetical protein ACFYY5_29010 [Nocardia elegans]|uniref:DNA-binding phage zinc finger domain-containing protein n=1 Tax=Nocardia elegans TaxID=300029 RepID=A0ABW6TL87_9NOCA
MNRADTTHVLDRITQYDARPVTGDHISEWHYQIGHLDRAVALEAVAIHHKVSTEPITPQHVLDLAEQIAQRVTTQRPMRRAVMTTYTLTGAINEPCPHCGAQPGETCTSASGHEAFAPCVARLLGKKTAA